MTERSDLAELTHPLSAGAAADNAAENTSRVQDDLIRTMLRQVPVALIASFICAGLMAYVVWDSVPRVPLLIWATLVAASTSGRLLLWYRTNQQRDEVKRFELRSQFTYITAAAIGGALWGGGSAFMILSSNSHWDLVFVGFVSGGMGAGAMASLSGYPPAFLASLLPNFIPCAIAYFAREDEHYPIMGGMIVVFGLALLFFGRTMYRGMSASATLRFANLDLVERLGRAREAAEALVVERTQALSQANRDLERRMRESRKAERALGQAAAQLRLIADNAPVYIALIGPDHCYRFANEAYHAAYGQPVNQIIGRPIAQVAGQEVYDEVRPSLERAFAGESVTYEGIRRTSSGERMFRVTLVPHRDDTGAVDSVVGLSVDLTEERLRERELRESEERLRRVIQNMPVMMYALDERGSLIVWNRECWRVTGYDADRIVGNPDAFSLLFPDAVYRSDVRQSVFAHEDFRDWETRVTCADGSEKTVSWFNISGSFPVPGWAIWGMGVDVSDRAKALVTLEEALGRERELSELKSRFVAMASHEFRTPLTSIQASVDMLRRYGDRMSEDQKLENLRGISREIATVTALLEDILTLGRADAGRLEFRPTAMDLRALCIDLIEKAKLLARPDHAFTFDCIGGCASVYVDEQLIRHIVTNMLTNAVKYSPKGGPIRLALRCAEAEITLSVSDQGIGIPSAGREHLFETFHRFSNVGAISGTGLGLAIMKRAAERHGGRIMLESEEGRGTTVTAVLPSIAPATVA